MKKNLIYIIPAVIIVAGLLVWAGIWIGGRKSPSSNLDNSEASNSSSEQSSLSNPGGLSVENSSSNATNLGQLGANSSSQSGIGSSAEGSSSSQSNATSSSGSGSSATSATDPSTFAQYNKYSTSTTALFGDVQVGTGTTLAVGQTAVITYKGYLTNGTLFDESKTESNGQLQPLTFVLGQHQVITGMEEGISGMKVGGSRLIIIPPGLGYGSTAQGSIPPNSVLIFIVDLLDVQ